MEIKLSTGAATIKDFCSHKTKKQIDNVLFKDAVVGADGKISGFKLQTMEEANLLGLTLLVEKLTIDGVEQPITNDTFDELDEKDFRLLVDGINKVTGKELPNEQSVG